MILPTQVRCISEKPYGGTAQRFEKYVKEELLYRLRLVKTDYKNYLPDFLGNDGRFYECKRYNSCKSLASAVKKWKTGQPKQAAHFEELIDKGFKVSMIVSTKRGIHLIDWRKA